MEKETEIIYTNPLNQDEIQMYLRDIRKLKVMTPDRERQLADKMLSETCSEQEREQIYRELVEGNLRFVITVAKQYQNQGIELTDLIAEGNVGLMKAIKNFNWNRRLRFISYAVWWIKQSILQSLNDHSRTIRLPVNIVQDMYKAKKEIQKHNNNDQIDDRFNNLPITVGLDNVINEEGDTLIDFIENKNSLSPDDSFNTKEILKEKLFNIMSMLDERERIIVEDYYGIVGCARTLEDIGNDFGLTKERVRQIKEKALRKLRNECSDLFEYL